MMTMTAAAVLEDGEGDDDDHDDDDHAANAEKTSPVDLVDSQAHGGQLDNPIDQ